LGVISVAIYSDFAVKKVLKVCEEMKEMRQINLLEESYQA